MKNFITQVLFVLLLGMFTSAMAYPADGTKIKITDGAWGTGSGGEFNIDVLYSPDYLAIDYVSFCLETNEYITPGYTYLCNAWCTKRDGRDGQ